MALFKKKNDVPVVDAKVQEVSRSDLNLENQRLKLEEYAKSRGWSYEIFVEAESTRKTCICGAVMHLLIDNLNREFHLLLFELLPW